MHNNVWRTLTAALLLVTLCLGQLRVASYACTSMQDLVSATTAASTTVPDPHEDLRAHYVAVVCHAHCDVAAQPAHPAQCKASPLALTLVIWGRSAIPELAILPQRPTHPEPILVSTPPPPRILFQVLRS